MESEITLETLWQIVQQHLNSNGFNQHGDARVNVAGFVPATEGSAMMHGVIGAKGGFLEGVDLNYVNRGGIYMIPNYKNVVNTPFLDTENKFWSELIVLRNFANNADASDDEVNVFQFFFTHSETPSFSYRSKQSKDWSKWKYLTPVRLWEGSETGTQQTDISLNRPHTDFEILKFEYQMIRAGNTAVSDAKTNGNFVSFSLRSFNLPNSKTGENMVEFGELNITAKDSKTLTLAESCITLAKNTSGNLYLTNTAPVGEIILKSVYGINCRLS